MFKNKIKIVIIAGLGLMFLCLVCGILGTFLPDGEEASAPAEIATQVQLPEDTPLPTDTAEPTKTPRPTEIPTKAPTGVPIATEDEVAEYFLELVPGSVLMAATLENLSDLFINAQIFNDSWYNAVTGQMSKLAITAEELAEVPVPDNCDVCEEVNWEMQIVYSLADDAYFDWIDWQEDISNTFYLESIGWHITEIGNAAARATAIMERYNK